MAMVRCALSNDKAVTPVHWAARDLRSGDSITVLPFAARFASSSISTSAESESSPAKAGSLRLPTQVHNRSTLFDMPQLLP